jgi:mono/diheme cytochrome c family protein
VRLPPSSPTAATRVGLIALALAGSACGATHARATAGAARHLFVKAGCGHCHALSDARTRGGAGPDFDTSERLNRAQLLQGMVEGANGMPSYAHRLTKTQRRMLAEYLLRVGWSRPRHARAPTAASRRR